MEEKELNLCELLKGCEGEEFYSLIDGEQKISYIDCHNIIYLGGYSYYQNGFLECCKEGNVLLYPSRALYEKYPLDAYSAWMEWKEGRKQKYQVRAIIEYWEVGKSSKWTTPYNIMVSTKEEAQQVAEVVKNTLRKFHDNPQNKPHFCSQNCLFLHFCQNKHVCRGLI